MLDLLKKSVIIFAIFFILVLLLYVAFYLFLVAVTVMLGVILFAKWKTTIYPYLRRIFSTQNKPSPSTPGQMSTRKVIDVEYEEITTTKR